MCPGNICTSPVKLMYTAEKISTCPDWKVTCPVGQVTTKVYVPWDKIYMPRVCGHALMSSPDVLDQFHTEILHLWWLTLENKIMFENNYSVVNRLNMWNVWWPIYLRFWGHFTNDFSIVIRWKFHSALIRVVVKWLLWNFAQGTTAVLSWHVQNFVAIWYPTMELH